MRNSFARINLRNLEFNYRNLRNFSGGRKVMAVVKADAYGHGMTECVKFLETLEDKPEYYAVALSEEAAELRNSISTDIKILCFAPFLAEDIDNYLSLNIMPTIGDKKALEYLTGYHGKSLKVHINIDTGMGRLGLNHAEAFPMIKKLAENENIHIDGIYTHFAAADEYNKDYSELQLERFNNLINRLKEEGIHYGLAHTANSAAVLDLPEARFDMIRPGISLYGYYPSEETNKSVELKPVMELVSKISTVKNITAGNSVSYGRLYIASGDIVSGTVGVGYADGYNRLLTNKAKAYIEGKEVKQIGRVTMDRIMFDVSDIPDPTGKEIILMGNAGNSCFTAREWAEICNTIPYEITCNISKRVPRVYIS